MPLFDPSHFAINALTIPMAMTGAVTLGLGVWIFLINRFDRLYRDYLLVCCVLAGWFLTQALAFSALRPEEAVPLTRVTWAIVLFLTPTIFALNTRLLGYRNLRERVAPLLFIMAAIFLPTVATDWFISGSHVDRYPYALVPRCGPINVVYLVIFLVTFTSIIVLRYRRMKDPSLSPRDRASFQLIFTALTFCSLGLLDWMQCLGVPVLPLGFSGVIIWVFCFAYAIFRYRLFRLTLTLAGPTIIEALPGALFVVNTASEIVIVNPGALAMTGETEPALLGRSVRDFLAASEETLKCALLNLESGSCILDGLETALKLPGGREVPVSLSARVIRRPDGVPNGAIFIAVEITRLKEEISLVEQQKAELVQAVEGMRRTQKLLIGRENRMIELEQEIEELKGKNKPPAP